MMFWDRKDFLEEGFSGDLYSCWDTVLGETSSSYCTSCRALHSMLAGPPSPKDPHLVIDKDYHSDSSRLIVFSELSLNDFWG